MDLHFNLFVYVRAKCFASMAYSYLGRWNEALEEGQKAMSVAERFLDDSSMAFATVFTSIACCFRGNLARAIEYGELAIRKASTPADKMWGQAVLAHALSKRGEAPTQSQVLDSLNQMAKDASLVSSWLIGVPWCAEANLLAGDYDKAELIGKEMLERAERGGGRTFVGLAHRLLGEIALKTNPDEAAPHFDQAISILKEIKAENELALAYSGMGRYHKQRGDTDQAREYLTKALEIFERLGTLIEPDKVREELAELPQ